MKEKLILWYLNNWTPDNPEKLIRELIRKWTPNKHLSSNPVRKEKASNE